MSLLIHSPWHFNFLPYNIFVLAIYIFQVRQAVRNVINIFYEKSTTCNENIGAYTHDLGPGTVAP